MREYDKLVRDDIPAIIRDDGEEPVVDVVEGEAYRERLHEKLREEAAEFRDDPSAAEAADVREVFAALLSLEGIEDATVERARKEKARTRGRFEEGIVLKAVDSLSDDSDDQS